jgi:hypothetical protein
MMGTGRLFDFAGEASTRGLFWFVFLGDLLAIIGALGAGVLGSRSERKEARLRQEVPSDEIPRIGREVG